MSGRILFGSRCVKQNIYENEGYTRTGMYLNSSQQSSFMIILCYDPPLLPSFPLLFLPYILPPSVLPSSPRSPAGVTRLNRSGSK